MKKLIFLMLGIILMSCSSGNEPVTGKLLLNNQTDNTIHAYYLYKANNTDIDASQMQLEEDWGLKLPYNTVSPLSSATIKLTPGNWILKIKNNESDTYWIRSCYVAANDVVEVIFEN